jgi:VanZ family protein
VTPAGRGWAVAAALWAVVIVLSGVLPTQGPVHAVAGGRDALLTTMGHFVAYAVLGFLLAVALAGWEVRGVMLAWALVSSAALGVAIELIQGPLLYRDAQSVDAVVDIAGAALGLVLFSVVAPVLRRRSRRG